MKFDEFEYRGGIAVRIFAGEHFIHHRAHRIKIRALIQRLAHALFWAHIGRAAPEFTGVGQAFVLVTNFCQTKVNDFDEVHLVIHQNYVAWLEIAVDDPLFVSVIKSAAYLYRNAGKSLNIHRPLVLNQSLQTAAAQVVHDYVRLIVWTDKTVIHGDNIGVTECA